MNLLLLKNRDIYDKCIIVFYSIMNTKRGYLLYCTPKVGHFWGVFYEI